MAVETKRIATRILQALCATTLALGGCVSPAGPAMPGAHGSGGNTAAVFEKLQARRAARNAAAASPRQAAPAPGVGDLLAQGDRARDDGDLAAALFAYLRAHRAAEGDTWAAAARIGYLHLRNEPMRAEALFERLVAEHPDVSQLHTGLALARLAQSRARDARAPLERAVALDAGAATPRNVIGVLLDRLGDHSAAQEQYRAAHALRPSDPAILNNLGVSLLLSGHASEATQALRQALHNAPGDPATRNNLAVALALDDQIAEAYTLFADAGGDARAHNNLGYVLHLRGEHTRALDHFEQALGVTGEELPTVLANLERTQTALIAGTGATWHAATAIAEAETATEPAVEVAEVIVAEPVVEIAEEVAPEPVVEIAEEVAPEPVVEIAEEVAPEPVVEIAEEVAPEPVVEIAEEVAPEPVVEIAEEVAPEPVVEIAEEVAPEPVVEIAEEVAPEPVVEVAEVIAPDPIVEIAEEVAPEPIVEIAEEVAPEPIVEVAEEVAPEPIVEVAEVIAPDPIVEIAPEPLVPIREVEVALVPASAVAPRMLARPPVQRVELSLDVPSAEAIEAPAAAGFTSRSFNEIVEALLGPAGPQLPRAEVEPFDLQPAATEAPVASLDPTAS